MKTLLQFSDVTCGKITGLCFSLAVGQIAILQVHNKNKGLVMELALGEKTPEKGTIFFRGKPLEESIPGEIGWVPSNGGVIGNLKVWENITLPLWYHHKRAPLATEQVLGGWLQTLEPEKNDWADFMARPSARLGIRDRKLVGLLRGLVLAPRLLVADAGLFNDTDQAVCNSWMVALEKFVKAAEDCAVLVISDGAEPLHWKIANLILAE